MIDQMEIKTEIDTFMMLGALGVNDSVSEWYLELIEPNSYHKQTEPLIHKKRNN